MKTVFKSKVGFTLIEMVLVLAIIVILAAIVALQIGGYMQRAKNVASSVSEHNSVLDSVTEDVV